MECGERGNNRDLLCEGKVEQLEIEYQTHLVDCQRLDCAVHTRVC